MLDYFLNDNIILNQYITDVPEITFSTNLDGNIFSDVLTFQLIDRKGYLSDVIANNPYRFKFKIYDRTENIYEGIVTNYNNVRNNITLQVKNIIDYSNVLSNKTNQTNIIKIVMFLMDETNTAYDKNSLFYAMVKFNPYKFLFAYDNNSLLKDLMGEIVNKLGVFVYNYQNKIYFDSIPENFESYTFELFDNMIISLEQENNIDNISNQYSTKYYNNTDKPISDTTKYLNSRNYFGEKNIREIDGSSGLIYLNKATAEYCSNLLINRTSYLNYRTTIEIKYDRKLRLQLGQVIKYSDTLYYLSEYGYNKEFTKTKLVMLSENKF